MIENDLYAFSNGSKTTLRLRFNEATNNFLNSLTSEILILFNNFKFESISPKCITIIPTIESTNVSFDRIYEILRQATNEFTCLEGRIYNECKVTLTDDILVISVHIQVNKLSSLFSFLSESFNIANLEQYQQDFASIQIGACQSKNYDYAFDSLKQELDKYLEENVQSFPLCIGEYLELIAYNELENSLNPDAKSNSLTIDSNTTMFKFEGGKNKKRRSFVKLESETANEYSNLDDSTASVNYSSTGSHSFSIDDLSSNKIPVEDSSHFDIQTTINELTQSEGRRSFLKNKSFSPIYKSMQGLKFPVYDPAFTDDVSTDDLLNNLSLEDMKLNQVQDTGDASNLYNGPHTNSANVGLTSMFQQITPPTPPQSHRSPPQYSNSPNPSAFYYQKQPQGHRKQNYLSPGQNYSKPPHQSRHSDPRNSDGTIDAEYSGIDGNFTDLNWLNNCENDFYMQYTPNDLGIAGTRQRQYSDPVLPDGIRSANAIHHHRNSPGVYHTNNSYNHRNITPPIHARQRVASYSDGGGLNRNYNNRGSGFIHYSPSQDRKITSPIQQDSNLMYVNSNAQHLNSAAITRMRSVSDSGNEFYTGTGMSNTMFCQHCNMPVKPNATICYRCLNPLAVPFNKAKYHGQNPRNLSHESFGYVNNGMESIDRSLINNSPSTHVLKHRVESPGLLGHKVETLREGDWICELCQGHNFATKIACFTCHAARPGFEHGIPMNQLNQLGIGRLGGSSAEAKPGDWTCPKCNENVFAKRNRCYRCTTARPRKLSI